MRQPSFVKLIKNSLLQGKSVGKNGLECQDKRGHNICRYFGIFCQKYNLTALDADNKMNKRSFNPKMILARMKACLLATASTAFFKGDKKAPKIQGVS